MRPTTHAMLRSADARLDTGDPSWRSLAPDRARASTLADIGTRVLPERAEAADEGAWAEGLVAIATAMRESFPDNLLWDLDRLGASLWRSGDASAIATLAAAIADVQRIYGRNTPIAFRYVHDFTYGFDWAKWVARDPDTRADVEPFSPTFVAAMAERGRELMELLAAGGDAMYPRLPPDRVRNPFGFSREPEAELELMRHLATADLIPVRAWSVAEPARWDRPYGQLRRDAAAALGLAM